MIKTSWREGRLEGESIVRGRKTVGDLQTYWLDFNSVQTDELVYETESWFSRPDGTEGAVLWASTKLYNGSVNGECFMTRGHFHTKSTHGELIIVVSGQGILALCDRDGNASEVALEPGITHFIDGSLAHRTINTGKEPLIFWCSWSADCGHDYETQAAFKRVFI